MYDDTNDTEEEIESRECDHCGCDCTCADDGECDGPDANCDCGCTREGSIYS